MTLWLDAQLPPLLAGWINSQGWGIEAVAIRDLQLRDASDSVIFQAARAAGAIEMTKDRDFIRLVEQQGPCPRPSRHCGVLSLDRDPPSWVSRRESIVGQGSRSPEGSGWAVRLGYRQCVAAPACHGRQPPGHWVSVHLVLGLGEGGVWLYRRWTQPITPDR